MGIEQAGVGVGVGVGVLVSVGVRVGVSVRVGVRVGGRGTGWVGDASLVYDSSPAVLPPLLLQASRPPAPLVNNSLSVHRPSCASVSAP